MTVGAGKYDDLAVRIAEQTDADGVALIVLGGNKGNGFSANGIAVALKQLPEILRDMADAVESDIKKLDIN